MANALLERAVKENAAPETQAGWAAGRSTTADAPAGAGMPPTTGVRETMSMGGVASATGVLFVLLLATGVVGWNLVDPGPQGQVVFPGWILIAIVGGVGLAFLISFRPELARVVAPAYALVEGLILGAISRVYENQWNGIVLQAVIATAVVFATMLFLYGTRLIKVTERMRRVIVGATIAVMAFYMLSLVLSIFGATMPLIWDAGPFGIMFSLVVIGVAAFTLVLDFDLVERGVEAGMPRQFEWYCGFALMVSIVWVYLEMLRLFAKLRQ